MLELKLLLFEDWILRPLFINYYGLEFIWVSFRPCALKLHVQIIFCFRFFSIMGLRLRFFRFFYVIQHVKIAYE